MVLRRCPFCDVLNCEVRYFPSEDRDHYVFCMNCGASGPVADTPWGASVVWNRATMAADGETEADTPPETTPCGP
jgi:hypothetical protein